MEFAWTGRIDPNSKGRRFHQVIRNVDSEELQPVEGSHFGIVGFECDEGVKRNKGRVGAAKAPNQIRKYLASIPYHPNKENVIDIGNVACTDEDLESAQENLGAEVARLLNNRYTPIILGGGHETFYGHYLGVRKALGPDKKIGMINLDAHFDLRNDPVPSSGTMFRQILEKDENARYLCIGLQELGNTEQLFLTAKQFDVEYILETDLLPLEHTFQQIDAFSEKHDYVIYTICSDVINQSAAPGVSAPAPFGIEPKVVRAITKHIIKQDNFISMDISEVNPLYDVDGQTARLASYVIAEALHLLND